MIRLEKFNSDHITSELLAWLNNRDLMRFSRHRYRLHTNETAFAFLKSFADSNNYYWAVYEDYRMIGTATAYIENGIADLGLLIGQPGRGYGKRTWGVLLDVLRSLGMDATTGGTYHNHVAMRKIMVAWRMSFAHKDEQNVYYRIDFTKNKNPAL